MSLIKIKDCISLSLQKEYRVRKYSKKKDACEIVRQMNYENYVCVLKYLDGQSIKDTLESNGTSETWKEAIELLADAEQYPGEQCGVEELGPTDFLIVGYGYTGTVLLNNPKIICREHFTGGSCLEESSLTAYVQINNTDILRIYIAKDDIVIDIDEDDVVYHKERCADNEELADMFEETSDEDFLDDEWDEGDSPKIGVREFYFDADDDHDEYGNEMERDIDSALYDMDQEAQLRRSQYEILSDILTALEVNNERMSLYGLADGISQAMKRLNETVQKNYKAMEEFAEKCWDYYREEHNPDEDEDVDYEEEDSFDLDDIAPQLSEEEREKREEASLDTNAMDWMYEYGEYVDKDPEITFDGKLFVFSGISKWHEIEEKDDPLVQKVLEKGGQYRSKVSGVTDYLIVDPRYCGYSKTKEAIKQIEKGKTIKIILVSDLESILLDGIEEKSSFERRKAIDYNGLFGRVENNCYIEDDTLVCYLGKPEHSDLIYIPGGPMWNSNAFDESLGYSKVVVPQGVKIIGKNSFSNSDRVECVVMPEDVQTIEECAFFGCSRLESIAIPSSVTSIRDDIFDMGHKGTIVIHAESNSYAEQYAKSNRIPVVLDYADYLLEQSGDLAGKMNLTGIDEEVSDVFHEVANPVYVGDSSTEPIPYVFIKKDDKEGIIAVPDIGSSHGRIDASGTNRELAFIGTLKEVFEYTEYDLNLLHGTRTIKDRAFIKNLKIKSVLIPGTLEVIPTEAFFNCYILKRVIISEGVKEIGESAFSSSRNLDDVVLPQSLLKIGRMAFCECSKLKKINIPNGVQTIEDCAFYGCDLECVALPNTLRHIGREAFAYCNIKELVIPERIETIDSKAFLSCGLKSVILHGTLRIIETRTFKECEELEIIDVPEGIEEIRIEAFSSCSSLRQVSLPKSLRRIEPAAFALCEKLQSITIPEGVKIIDLAAFRECYGLKQVSLPKSLRRIEPAAFYLCEKLQSITIPEGVKIIDLAAFRECYELAFVNLPNSLRVIGESAFMYCEKMRNITIPEGTKTIEKWGFYGCSAIESISLPSTLVSIGEEAFALCENLKNVTLPIGIKKIASKAFSGCSQLESITFLGDNIPEIAEDAFENCPLFHTLIEKNSVIQHNDEEKTGTNSVQPYNLDVIDQSRVNAAMKCEACAIDESIFEVRNHDDKSIHTVTYRDGFFECDCSDFKEAPKNCSHILRIRSKYFGLEIEAEEEQVAETEELDEVKDNSEKKQGEYRKTIERFVVPEGIETIGSHLFGKSYNGDNCLKEIQFPRTLRTIKDYAFAECHLLEKAVIPEGVESIGEGAFSYCENLRCIVLPKSLRVIGCNAFYSSCKLLEKIVIPEGVESIGEQAFSGCENVRRIVLPESLKEIGEHAFLGCENVRCIALPKSLKKIGNGAFVGCKRLEELVIPEGVETIGEFAFCGCENLKEVKFPSSLRKIESNAFIGCGWKEVYLPRQTVVEDSDAFGFKCIIKRTSL